VARDSGCINARPDPFKVEVIKAYDVGQIRFVEGWSHPQSKAQHIWAQQWANVIWPAATRLNLAR